MLKVCHFRFQSSYMVSFLKVQHLMHLAGTELGALQGCKQLQELNLRGCYKLTNRSVAALRGLTALTLLNLHECWQITAVGVASLSSKASAG